MKSGIYIYIVSIFLCTQLHAQYLVSSNTSVESCNELDSCLTVNNHSYLYYDETKSEFFLKIDFSDFRSDARDSIENWLNRERDTCLYFRAIFPRENFPILTTEARRSYKLNGRVYYNKMWKDQSVDLTLFMSQNSLMNTTASIANYSIENYKVNFTIPFVPSDFKVYNELYYNDQTVNINVTLGRINLLKPGMEPLLSEVYYEPDR